MYGVIGSNFVSSVAFGLLTISACLVLMVALYYHIEVLHIFLVNKTLLIIAQLLVKHSLFFAKMARKWYHFFGFNQLFLKIAQKEISCAQKLIKYVENSLKDI